MTSKDYEENQKIPDRIASTEVGKQMVIDFIDIARRRISTDFGEKELKRFDTKIVYKLQSVFFYFTKWVIEYLVDNKKEDLKNSMIWIFTKNDDDCILTHNIVMNNFQDMSDVDVLQNKLIRFSNHKFGKIWSEYGKSD